MEETRGITVKVKTELHEKVKAEQEQKELTMSQYITMVLEEHFSRKGGITMEKTRTLAFQVSEKLFGRVKSHLSRNPRLTQKDFIIGLIEQALDIAETTCETGVQSSDDSIKKE